ncbi:DUF5688 family protein, partial [uncultured Acetatifactor sp.]|uniref:DUF5688 family protein n=2 Tax=uncultured Acetatifactor sp. TaxID=1671927 RepID=UPI00272DA849
ENGQQFSASRGNCCPSILEKEDAMKEKTMVKLPAAGRDISSITEAELADVIRDFDVIKGNIKVYLANKEAIWENHQDCPKKEVEGTDLLAVFRIMLFVKDVGQSSILVRNRTMAMWDIELESLYETALKNTMEQTPARVISLDDMIDYGPEKSKRPEEVSYENGKTYILGNSGTVGGAAAMLYPGVLQTIAENSSSNLFIVPSSINEVLVISDDGKADSQSLQYMLMEANMGMVPRKEVLSDQVYYYDREERRISTATTPEGTREQQLAMDAICQISYP